MERIAPLAKILAEANGIDWQTLHGSGEGGLIVDQDVVDYLMRVMSGEAEPPATPVDAPPPEWTGTELPAGGGLLAPGMPSMDMLSSAGVDSDLAALVGQPQMAQPVTSDLEETAPHDTSLEEDGLEFELEDDADAAPLAITPEPELPEVAALAPAAAADVEIVPVLPELQPEQVQPEPQAAETGTLPGVAASAVMPAPAEAPAPAATGGMMAGLGNLLSRLYHPAQQPAQQTAQPSAPQPVTLPPAAAQASPAPFVPPVVAEPVPAPQMDAPQVEAPVTEVPEVELAEVQAPEVELAVQPMAAQEAADPAPQVAEAEAEAVVTEPDMPVPEPLLSVSPQSQPHSAGQMHGAVWFGTYLRREANVAPAAELRRQLTGALGQDVPLALLVARAAQHHADGLGLSGVAVHDLDAGRARSVQSGPLRGALAALDTDHDGTPDLLVIDAGALDLDDLHLPHTLTLSVGRVQEGRAALTLNGDVDPARAARFLASVAATLEEPIILVL